MSEISIRHHFFGVSASLALFTDWCHFAWLYVVQTYDCTNTTWRNPQEKLHTAQVKLKFFTRLWCVCCIALWSIWDLPLAKYLHRFFYVLDFFAKPVSLHIFDLSKRNALRKAIHNTTKQVDHWQMKDERKFSYEPKFRKIAEFSSSSFENSFSSLDFNETYTRIHRWMKRNILSFSIPRGSKVLKALSANSSLIKVETKQDWYLSLAP